METNYSKRPAWHWVVLCMVIAAILYGAVYYFKSDSAEAPAADKETLATITSLMPEISWEEPKAGNEEHFGLPGSPTLRGMEMVGTTDTDVSLFIKADATLVKQGWTQDLTLAADGVGDSIMGYKRTTAGKDQYLIFTSHTEFGTPASTEAPPQCPCQYEHKVFLSTHGDKN